MFVYCKFVDAECPFSDGVHCGQGKGESLIKDIIACDGKTPKYKVKIKYVRDRYGRRKKIEEEAFR